MPQGGRLSVAAAPAPDGRTVLITVEDSGCGIASDILPHIFEPFFSTKHEGARIGLGLATTFGIIERHHGTIDVHSRLGQGTVFTIVLPTGDIRFGE
jgi:signal transduction histidine kinase